MAISHADRGGNLEDQIELDRRDEPRRCGQLRVELPRSPAGVAGEHVRASRQRTRRQHAAQQHRRRRQIQPGAERLRARRLGRLGREDPAALRLDRAADEQRQIVRARRPAARDARPRRPTISDGRLTTRPNAPSVACSHEQHDRLREVRIEQLRHREQQRGASDMTSILLAPAKPRAPSAMASAHRRDRRRTRRRPSAVERAAARRRASGAARARTRATAACGASPARRIALPFNTRAPLVVRQPAQIEQARKRERLARLPRGRRRSPPRGGSTDRRPDRCRSRTPAAPIDESQVGSRPAPRVSIVRYDRQRVASS